MLHRLRTEPLLYLEQNFARFAVLDKMEIPNNIAIVAEGRYSCCFVARCFYGFAAGQPWPRGTFYVFFRLKYGRSCLVYGFGLLRGYGCLLYAGPVRICCLPLLCVAGGGGVRLLLVGWGQSGQEARMRRQRRLLLLLLAVFLVNSAYSHYHQFLEPAVLRRLQPDGMVLDLPAGLVIYDHGPLTVGGTVLMPLERISCGREEIFQPGGCTERSGSGRPGLAAYCYACAQQLHFRPRTRHAGNSVVGPHQRPHEYLGALPHPGSAD